MLVYYQLPDTPQDNMFKNCCFPKVLGKFHPFQTIFLFTNPELQNIEDQATYKQEQFCVALF